MIGPGPVECGPMFACRHSVRSAAWIAPVVVLLPLVVLAQSAAAQVTVADPWVRGTVAGQMATGAFMQLRSATDTTLVGVSSPAAKIVEVHEMKMVGGVMKMSAVDRLPLPAGKAVELKSGGYHVMLMDLKRPLAVGEKFTIDFRIETADGKRATQLVEVEVRARAPHGSAFSGDSARKH